MMCQNPLHFQNTLLENSPPGQAHNPHPPHIEKQEGEYTLLLFESYFSATSVMRCEMELLIAFSPLVHVFRLYVRLTHETFLNTISNFCFVFLIDRNVQQELRIRLKFHLFI